MKRHGGHILLFTHEHGKDNRTLKSNEGKSVLSFISQGMD